MCQKEKWKIGDDRGEWSCPSLNFISLTITSSLKMCSRNNLFFILSTSTTKWWDFYFLSKVITWRQNKNSTGIISVLIKQVSCIPLKVHLRIPRLYQRATGNIVISEIKKWDNLMNRLLWLCLFFMFYVTYILFPTEIFLPLQFIFILFPNTANSTLIA